MLRQLITTLAAAMLLLACNNEADQKPVKLKLAMRRDSTAITQVVAGDDSSLSVQEAESTAAQDELDSVMRIEVELPPLLDANAYDTATINKFTRLASVSKGDMRLLVSAKLLEENISRVLCDNAPDNADVLFMIDNTGSMSDDIEEVRQGLAQIIGVLKEKKGVRLAVATYRDVQVDSLNWFSFRNFEKDFDAAKGFIDSIEAADGGDLPESVYEAFFAAADHHFWRSSTRRIVLIIGDARGKEKADGGRYNIEDVMNKARENSIRVNFFPLIVTPYSGKYRSGGDSGPQPETEKHLITQVFPNPATGPIRIQLAESGRYRIGIYNMAGVMVEERYIDGDYWLVDMNAHPDGLYVIRVSDKNNQYDVAKFVMKR